MGIVKRQGIKAAIVSYFGIAFGMVNLLYLYPKFLQPEEIGLIRTLVDLATLLVPFALIGVTSVIVRYTPYFANSRQQQSEFASLFLGMPFIGFIVVSILIYVFKDAIIDLYEDNSPLLVKYMLLILPLIFFTIYHNVFEAYCRSLLRIAIPKLIRDVLIRALTAILIISYAFIAFDLNKFIYIYIGIFFIAVLVLVLYALRLQPIRPTTKFKVISSSYLKEILTYSFYVLLGSLGGAFIAKVDILMLSSMIGLKGTGIYTISLFMGTVIEIPRRAISQISVAVIAKSLKEEKLGEIAVLYKKTALNQLIVGGFLIVVLWASVDHLFDIMPKGNIYQEGKYVVLFIALAKLFDMAMGVNNEILVMSKYYRYNIYLMAFFIALAFATNYIFIPKFGLAGAAAATLISVVVYNIARFSIVYLVFKIHPFSRETLITVLFIVITYLIVMNIPRTINPVITMLIIGMLSSVIYWGLILGFNISADISKLVKQGVKYIRSGLF